MSLFEAGRDTVAPFEVGSMSYHKNLNSGWEKFMIAEEQGFTIMTY